MKNSLATSKFNASYQNHIINYFNFSPMVLRMQKMQPAISTTKFGFCLPTFIVSVLIRGKLSLMNPIVRQLMQNT